MCPRRKLWQNGESVGKIIDKSYMKFVFGEHEQCKLMCKHVRKKKVAVVTTNTHPQRVFSSVETCLLVDVNQPLPWFFTLWPREDSFPFS